MFDWLHTLFRRREPDPNPAIAVDATGFTLTHRGHSRAVPWSSIRRIAAFKEDLYSHDRIVLLIEAVVSGDPVLRLTEDYPGFADLFGPMESELGINPGWYLDIMTPAFEPTPQVIFLRGIDPRDLRSNPERA